ncbi:S9 family peptidase [Phenylobacterium montanum]|uniref:S9 family peptidase n=1 Tax=Phenylobacterium montanum TaxID=2823693 RepID=A0A975G3N7_9CAUL|nr:prolyl oligopeptidase family serine peptidase [Caulobacter sp. S6]QUD89922.1 S9 family peptidase [Caulobacter sp. S6]
MALLVSGAGALPGLVIAADPAPVAKTVPAGPPSASDFTREPVIWDVSISPDGQHIVALTSPDGVTPIISVWRTDQPNAKPVNLGAAHMRFLGVSFLKNDRLLVSAIQPLTFGVRRSHVIKQYVTDLNGKDWAALLPESRVGQSEVDEFVDRLTDASLVSVLSRDPRHVLVEDERIEGRGDIYRVDIYSGVAERLARGSEKVFGYQADLNGELRAKREFDYDKDGPYFAQWIKNPTTGAWEEHFRDHLKDRRGANLAAFTTDPNIVEIITSNGGEKQGIYDYDVKQKKILGPAFGHKLFDVGGDVAQSIASADYGEILGFSLQADRGRRYWVDDRLDAITKGLQQSLGVQNVAETWIDPGSGTEAEISTSPDFDIEITSWSADRKFMIVEKSGPRQPPEFYLLTDGTKLSQLGRSRPWIDPAKLGEDRLVEYKARDGLMIPAFLTTPPKAVYGPGPYPTLIEPHGGPWARDELDWDISGWTQYFASRGYAVLRPQFRGSFGWGQKLWRAGDGEWGQKMQDDKDDGVKWLIAQGIADPKRVAMFGYSYGGYAALAAAVRPNGLYQCAISGAGAGDLAALEKATFDNRLQRAFQHDTIKGLDALAHAKEAQIPVFLYHGDRDQTVEVEQSRKFAASLRAAGKPVRYDEIPEMGHQYVTMTPAMMEHQLVQIEDFLKTGCKPSGL